MRKTVEVIDNFFRKPYAIRELALDSDWTAPPSDGIRATPRIPLAVDAEAAAQLRGVLGVHPGGTAPDPLPGHFTFIGAAANGRLSPHLDDADWAAVVDLSLPEQCLGGTSFYRQPANGRDAPEETMHIPMAFNRMVLFRASRVLHGPTTGFGDSPETGRLARVFLFSDVPSTTGK